MLEKLRKDIDRDLKSLLADVKKEYKLNQVSPLLFSGMKDFFLRKGKRIRPALCIISYKGYTKKKNISHKKLVRSSLSLELMHDFLVEIIEPDEKTSARKIAKDLIRQRLPLYRQFN